MADGDVLKIVSGHQALGAAAAADVTVAAPLTHGNVQAELEGLTEALRIVDCGVIDATDLFDVPTLYTPTGGEIILRVWLDEIEPFVGNMDIAIGTLAGTGFNGDGKDWLDWMGGSRSQGSMLSEGPLLAGYNTGLLVPILAWQADHVYAAIEGVFEAGHIWYADGDAPGPVGSSGSVEPDWAQAIIDGTIVDNEITWYDDDTPPTAGSGHVYALVGQAPRATAANVTVAAPLTHHNVQAELEAVAEAGGASLSVATVTLSSADILAMHDTPPVIVAAPGTGKVYAIAVAWAIYHAGTTPYTLGDALQLGADAVAAENYNFTMSGDVLTSAVDQIANFEPNSYRPSDLGPRINTAITLATSANPTAGDGTLTVVVQYMVLDA